MASNVDRVVEAKVSTLGLAEAELVAHEDVDAAGERIEAEPLGTLHDQDEDAHVPGRAPDGYVVRGVGGGGGGGGGGGMKLTLHGVDLTGDRRWKARRVGLEN